MIHPVPKPEPRSESDRLTARIASSRKLNANRKPIPRSSPPSRTAPPKRENKERKAKQVLIRRQKHAAYRRSETYKAVEARSGGRCERLVNVAAYEFEGKLYPVWVRCPNKRSDGLRMTHNHKTYARYGGNERPEDMELLCPSCNALYESQKRGRRSFGGREGR